METEAQAQKPAAIASSFKAENSVRPTVSDKYREHTADNSGVVKSEEIIKLESDCEKKEDPSTTDSVCSYCSRLGFVDLVKLKMMGFPRLKDKDIRSSLAEWLMDTDASGDKLFSLPLADFTARADAAPKYLAGSSITARAHNIRLHESQGQPDYDEMSFHQLMQVCRAYNTYVLTSSHTKIVSLLRSLDANVLGRLERANTKNVSPGPASTDSPSVKENCVMDSASPEHDLPSVPGDKSGGITPTSKLPSHDELVREELDVVEKKDNGSTSLKAVLFYRDFIRRSNPVPLPSNVYKEIKERIMPSGQIHGEDIDKMLELARLDIRSGFTNREELLDAVATTLTWYTNESWQFGSRDDLVKLRNREGLLYLNDLGIVLPYSRSYVCLLISTALNRLVKASAAIETWMLSLQSLSRYQLCSIVNEPDDPYVSIEDLRRRALSLLCSEGRLESAIFLYGYELEEKLDRLGSPMSQWDTLPETLRMCILQLIATRTTLPPEAICPSSKNTAAGTTQVVAKGVSNVPVASTKRVPLNVDATEKILNALSDEDLVAAWKWIKAAPLLQDREKIIDAMTHLLNEHGKMDELDQHGIKRLCQIASSDVASLAPPEWSSTSISGADSLRLKIGLARAYSCREELSTSWSNYLTQSFGELSEDERCYIFGVIGTHELTQDRTIDPAQLSRILERYVDLVALFRMRRDDMIPIEREMTGVLTELDSLAFPKSLWYRHGVKNQRCIRIALNTISAIRKGHQNVLPMECLSIIRHPLEEIVRDAASAQPVAVETNTMILMKRFSKDDIVTLLGIIFVPVHKATSHEKMANILLEACSPHMCDLNTLEGKALLDIATAEYTFKTWKGVDFPKAQDDARFLRLRVALSRIRRSKDVLRKRFQAILEGDKKALSTVSRMLLCFAKGKEECSELCAAKLCSYLGEMQTQSCRELKDAVSEKLKLSKTGIPANLLPQSFEGNLMFLCLHSHMHDKCSSSSSGSDESLNETSNYGIIEDVILPSEDVTDKPTTTIMQQEPHESPGACTKENGMIVESPVTTIEPVTDLARPSSDDTKHEILDKQDVPLIEESIAKEDIEETLNETMAQNPASSPQSHPAPMSPTACLPSAVPSPTPTVHMENSKGDGLLPTPKVSLGKRFQSSPPEDQPAPQRVCAQQQEPFQGHPKWPYAYPMPMPTAAVHPMMMPPFMYPHVPCSCYWPYGHLPLPRCSSSAHMHQSSSSCMQCSPNHCCPPYPGMPPPQQAFFPPQRPV